MLTSETPLAEITGRIISILESANKPVTFKKLKDQLNKGSKNSPPLEDAQLKGVLETGIEQNKIYRWPDYKRSQYFSTQSPDLAAQHAAIAIASELALSKTELIATACKKVQGFSKPAMQRIVDTLLANHDLQAVPAFTAGKLLLRSGSQAAYLAAAQKFFAAKFRKAGFDPAAFLPSTPPGLPHPAPAADAPSQIVQAIQTLEHRAGIPVTTHRLRLHLPALSKSEFDTAAMLLRKGEKVYLGLHHDPHNITQQERDLLIDGGDGNYYVDIAIRG